LRRYTAAGGLDFIHKEAARREFEESLWAFKPDGDWVLLASTKRLQVRGREVAPHAFEKACFVQNTRTDTQAAVWRCATDRTVVVAFRGTEMDKPQDMITDANLTPTAFDAERSSSSGSEDARVHGGFLAAYDSVRSRVFAAVDDIIAHTPVVVDDGKGSAGVGSGGAGPGAAGSGEWHVFITGHSLGGALATLFAAELGASVEAGRRDCTVTMYNYGQGLTLVHVSAHHKHFLWNRGCV
jgi:hypothetical protein